MIANHMITHQWIEDVCNGISLMEGVPMHLEAGQEEEPGKKEAPNRPSQPDIRPPQPGEIPAPQAPQPEIEPYQPMPAADPVSPSQPTA